MGSTKVHMRAAPYWGHFKVFKMKGAFLCGICRKSYAAENQAEYCVRGCISHHVSPQADTLVRGLKTRFRCPFCYREYSDKNQASQCLSQCGAVASGAQHTAQVAVGNVSVVAIQSGPSLTYLDEDESLGMPTTRGGEEPVSGGMNVSSASRQSTGSSKPSFADHDDTAAAEGAPEKPQNIVVGDGEEGVIYREMNQKPFVRHNASYVCSACRNKFFTKADVEACFEAHPIRDPLI